MKKISKKYLIILPISLTFISIPLLTISCSASQIPFEEGVEVAKTAIPNSSLPKLENVKPSNLDETSINNEIKNQLSQKGISISIKTNEKIILSSYAIMQFQYNFENTDKTVEKKVDFSKRIIKIIGSYNGVKNLVQEVVVEGFARPTNEDEAVELTVNNFGFKINPNETNSLEASSATQLPALKNNVPLNYQTFSELNEALKELGIFSTTLPSQIKLNNYSILANNEEPSSSRIIQFNATLQDNVVSENALEVSFQIKVSNFSQ